MGGISQVVNEQWGFMLMKALIQNIKVTDRVRKEITKIDELAADIRAYGLLNPITVMSAGDDEFRLLAGLRRLKAVESIGLLEIEVHIVSPADAEAELRIEISENEQREPFTFSEKMNFARLLEEIEKAKAKERMSLGGKGGIEQGTPNSAYLEKGETREIVADKIGMGKSTYDCAKYVAKNAPDKIIEELDNGQRSIHGAYKEIRSKEKSKKQTAENVEGITPKKSENEETAVSTNIAVDSETADSDIESKTKEVKLDEKSVNTSKPAATHKPSKSSNIAALIPKEEEEAVRRNMEFHAMPPLEKVKELQRQLKEERSRAAHAESELSNLKEFHRNTVYHKDGIINNLQARLDEAEARVQELEAKYCPNDGI